MLPSANGRVTLDANGQQSFIDFLGFSTCSGGGENVVPTALIQVTNTTTTMTSTFSNVPFAAIASLTIAPVSHGLLWHSLFSLACSLKLICRSQQSSPASASAGAITGGPSTTIFPSVGAPHIVVGNKTIIPTANPIALAVFNGTFVGTATNLAGGTSAIILPTGYNISSNGTIIPFVGAGSLNRADAWIGVWGAAMIGLGALVIYL